MSTQLRKQPEGGKRLELHNLSKLGQVLNAFLNINHWLLSRNLDSLHIKTNLLGLRDLKEAVANGGFKQNVQHVCSNDHVPKPVTQCLNYD